MGDLGKPLPNGVNQAGLGDCWFLAGVAALAEGPKRLDELIKSAGIMIFVSHDLGLIKKFCSKVIWIEKGKIKDSGKTSDILNNYKKRYFSNMDRKENISKNK